MQNVKLAKGSDSRVLLDSIHLNQSIGDDSNCVTKLPLGEVHKLKECIFTFKSSFDWNLKVLAEDHIVIKRSSRIFKSF
jgi:hypothetical protein